MAIDWAPATRQADIAQCVRTLLATTAGSVPYARGLGLEGVLDEPSTAAAQRVQVAAVRAVREYEPRARVRRVALERSPEGALRPTVRIEEVPA